jgi:hypothetical protein
MAATMEVLREQRAQKQKELDEIDAQIQATRSRELERLGAVVLKLAKMGKIQIDEIVKHLSEKDRKLFDAPNETTLQAIADAGKGERLKFDDAIEKLKTLEEEATA